MELYVIILMVFINTVMWSAVYHIGSPIIEKRVLTPAPSMVYRVVEEQYRLERIRSNYKVNKYQLSQEYDATPWLEDALLHNLVKAIKPYVVFSKSPESRSLDPLGEYTVHEAEVKIGILK